MKIHILISALSGVALAMTSVAAPAENNGTWHFDDDLDTVVLDIPGSRDKYIAVSRTALTETPRMEHNETWYYDAEYDTIVLNVPGSRDMFISSPNPTQSKTPKMTRKESWYYDEEFDTIVLPFSDSGGQRTSR